MNTYQTIFAKDRYSKWLDDQRKETWEETCNRYCAFMNANEYKSYILNLQVMPSMRLMLTAGEAATRDNAAAYNCSYTTIDNLNRISEILYLLMVGCGVGFSVEKYYIDQLPKIPENYIKTNEIIVVKDTRRGWVIALKQLLNYLIKGEIPYINYSDIRPKGKRLKVFGGRSSGPEVLKELFDYIIYKFEKSISKKITSLMMFDICCKIAHTVECGGVRRCALICLCDIDDIDMIEAKTWAGIANNPHRTNCNISIVVDEEKPNLNKFFEMVHQNGTGEPGIFNRWLAKIKTKDFITRWGTNPCGEAIFKPQAFCNLTEVVCRFNDTWITIFDKARIATILGTKQATLTNFDANMLSIDWKRNAEQDRLLGVSLTGICDCPLFEDSNVEEKLKELQEYIKSVNIQTAKQLGINPAARTTCIKPSGTVSQLADCSAGIHPRFAQYYIRTVRFSKLNPMCRVLSEAGIKHEPSISDPERTNVFYFYTKSPYYKKYTAIDQIKRYLLFNNSYANHSVSCTVPYEESEWFDIMCMINKNINQISGITFFPNKSYPQAVYQEITKDEYEANAKEIDVDWTKLDLYEQEMDRELETIFPDGDSECSGGLCKIL